MPCTKVPTMQHVSIFSTIRPQVRFEFIHSSRYFCFGSVNFSFDNVYLILKCCVDDVFVAAGVDNRLAAEGTTADIHSVTVAPH